MPPKKHAHIVALDLDLTICEDAISDKNVDEFISFLDKFLGKNGSVYVITARRRVEDGEVSRVKDLLTSYVNPKIIDYLVKRNRGKGIREWVFFNESEKDLVRFVEREAKKEGILDIIQNNIPKEKDVDFETCKIMFYMGVVKMFQIKKIILKEIKKRKHNNIKLQFFDDSKYNKKALLLFNNKINDKHISKHVYFKGGTGKAVFGGTKVFYIHPEEGISKIYLPKYK